MRNTILFIPVILLTAACQQMEQESHLTPDAPAQSEITSGKVTILAAKGTPETKALDLVNDGATLNAYWKNGETVKVYKAGTLLGTLDVTPFEGSKPTNATLSGSITVTGLSQDDQLTLLLPRETWDYTGQNGVLTGTGSLEDSYAYATATVTVLSIAGSSVTTSKAAFVNAESIYRFGFKLEDNYIDPKSFTVSATGGQLVQSMNWNGSAWAPSYGSITVASALAPADHFFYVSLRNDRTEADTYHFVITGADDALYIASKTIPANVLDAPRFISAKSIAVSQPSLVPANGVINDPENVF
jgi:hypothetical protein